MKNITILLILLNITFNSFSQELDKVYLKNKEVVSGKILNVTSENIEINPKGNKPFLILKRNDAKLIIYSDNTIVSFSDDKSYQNDKSNNNIVKINKRLNSKIFIDRRDNQEYKIKKIGDQVWMTENMRYKTNRSTWLGKDYGMFYPFNDALSVCPEGWHLPTEDDWMVLINKFGGMKASTSKKLRSHHGHELSMANGSNESGFNAAHAGMRIFFENGSWSWVHYQKDSGAYFWTAEAYYIYFIALYKIKIKPTDDDTKYEIPCRCIRDD